MAGLFILCFGAKERIIAFLLSSYVEMYRNKYIFVYILYADAGIDLKTKILRKTCLHSSRSVCDICKPFHF